MALGRYDAIQRGYDSSGRPCILTRQHWQFIDRLNEGPAKGLLVVVQGGFRRGSGAAQSGDTHDLGKCADFRRWNMTSTIASDVKRKARELGGSMWERTSAQGFDPHFHNLLVGDQPGSSGANAQESAYLAGYNGLGSGYRGYRDDFWRPSNIRPYNFLEEDDMANEGPEILRIVKSMDKELSQFRTAEWKRDKAERDRFKKFVTSIGQEIDLLGVEINQSTDESVKRQLQKTRQRLLRRLADDPDVTGVDNPDEDALG